VRIELALSDRVTSLPAVLEGVLRAGDRAWAIRAPVSGAAGPTPSGGAATGDAAPQGAGGFRWALLLAFAGGVILNLMPCVFPVLSIKILGFVRESETRPREVRVHGLLYGAGVILSFQALAGALYVLKAGGERLGWGFQLQSPAVIFLLIAVLFLVALNLLGVFEAGLSVARAAGSVRWGEGRLAAFGTGVLAVFLATPCTAPFMGTALGYAAVQPAHIGLGVFTALAVGMAAPYVLLSFVPHLGARLPGPGRWMETFRQAMAFPLLATVIWLLWVLGLQAGMAVLAAALAGLLVMAFAGWIFGRWRSGTTKAVAGALIAGAIAGVLVAARGAAPTAGGGGAAGEWAPWSEARVAEARAAGRPVFVDFTAAWCLTCKVNEAVALNTADVRAALAAKRVVTLKADWTNPDPAIEAALASFGRNGVPLYVLYPADPAAPPRILPQILATSLVVAELNRL
jgi:thiol:disulfide interchange protein DsbD